MVNPVKGVDDDYIMAGFEDLFEDYHYETTYYEHHSGDEIEIDEGGNG